MTVIVQDNSGQLILPLGARYVDALLEHPASEVRALAKTPEALRIFDAVQYVMDDNFLPGFLHSAMCAMSLPVRRPKDEFAPIFRQDGNYSLIITPLERHEPTDKPGVFNTVKRGVPFGSHARLVLFFIMSEAVRLRTREIYLGKSFSAWMRRMGIKNTSSGGSRGTRSLVQDQVDRLMSCQWSMRWDEKIPVKGTNGKNGKEGRGGEIPLISAFAVNDMRMVNQYAGVRNQGGDFVSHFVLSEAFYDNLLKYSVPLNERAYAVLKKSPTQMDLYTWLAHRLPKIKHDEEVRLRWSDLAKHLGNDTASMFKFRQTVRSAWQEVSGVYQQARHSVFLDDLLIRLRHAERPDEGHLKFSKGKVVAMNVKKRVGEQLNLPSSAKKEVPDELEFPDTNHLSYASPELYMIGQKHGSNNDVSIMAGAFRKRLGAELERLKGDQLKYRWQKYCESWPAPR